MSSRTIQLGGHRVEVSRADKVLFPRDGLTKGDIAEYYHRVGTTLVRYTKDRPLASERYPDGIEGQRIFQKNVSERTPRWVRRVEVPKREGGRNLQVVCEEPDTLVHLADQGSLTPHVWLSRIDDLERPDRMVFDLDPSDNGVEELRSAAHHTRRVLEEVGLPTFVMTTGSRGFHVLVPLRREDTFHRVREFARGIATVLSERSPELLTAEQRKEDRAGRIFVDYLRNSYAQTTVAPYSVRARNTAPVAMPISWHELDEASPRGFTVGDVPQRLATHGDEWSGIGNRATSLTRPRQRLAELHPGS